MTKNVMKSKIELSGPKTAMKRRTKAMSQAAGRATHLGVDAVGRDRHLPDVVEQVVEQDLRRQHRQERQEQRRAGGAEHVAEVRRGRHQHVLERVGEDAPALHDAVGEHAEVLVEQHDVGGVLGDVGGGVDGDADVGGMQRDGVVDAVAEERDVDARAPRDLDEPRLLVGADAREDRRVGDGGGERVVVEAARSRRRSGRRSTARPMSRQTLAATAPLSPVMILTVDAERRRARRSRRRRRPSAGRRRSGTRPAAGRARRRQSAAASPAAARVATATTRAPSANSASSTARRASAGRRRSARARPRARPW